MNPLIPTTKNFFKSSSSSSQEEKKNLSDTELARIKAEDEKANSEGILSDRQKQFVEIRRRELADKAMRDFIQKFINGKTNKPGLFSGNRLQTLILYLEVLKNNRSDCSLSYYKIKSLFSKDKKDQTFSQINNLIDDNFLEQLQKCTKNGKILPLIISTSNHTNMIIVNTILKTVEMFEPHGIKQDDLDDKTNAERVVNVIKFVNELNKKNIDKDIYSFIPPTDVCPKDYIGFQVHDDRSTQRMHPNLLTVQINDKIKIENKEGYCTAWSLWFLDLRLRNPYIPVQELLKFALDSTKENWSSIRRLITQYTSFSFNTLKEIVEKLDFPFDEFVDYFYKGDIINNERSADIFFKILNQIAIRFLDQFSKG